MKLTNTYGEVLDLAILTPSIQAYDIVQVTNLLLEFERGNGSKYIAIVSDAPITILPSDFVSYTLGQTFSDGSYVIAKGTLNSIDISNLATGTWYVRIFEFNGFGGLERYNRDTANDNPLEFTIESGFILREDEFYLLRESGDKLIRQ